MADTMRPISFLPTIKCSDCGQDIEISNMADHVCSGAAPPLEAPAPAPAGNRQKYGASLSPASSTFSKPGRQGDLYIDPGSANKPFAQQKYLATPESNYGSQRSPSPGPGSSSYSYSKHADPYGMSYGTQNEQRNQRFDSAMGSPESDSMYGARSPRSGGADSVLKRMDSVAPGPFSSRNSRRRTEESNGAADPMEHRRMASKNSMRQNDQPVGMGSSYSSHAKKPSASSLSEYSRSSAFSNRSMGYSARPDHARKPSRPSRPDDDDQSFTSLRQRDRSRSRDPNQGNRSNMGYMARRGLSTDKALPNRPPRDTEDDENDRFAPRPFGRSATDPVRQPADPFARGRRNQSQGSNGFPSRSTSRSASRGRGRVDPRVEDAPPVPPAPKTRNGLVGNRKHAPSDSESSVGSVFSNSANTGSSRSTPPGSEDLGYPSKPPGGSLRGARGPALAETPQLPSGPAAGLRGGAPSMRRQNVPQALPSNRFDRGPNGPESPMDPAIQAGMFSPPSRAEKPSAPQARAPKNLPPPPADFDDDYRAPMPKPRNAGPRKPTGQSKGMCRACGEDIFGKSVKAADGRLTGRYHKQCFVCKTCKSPFQTADFYVFNNSPYCEQHYHQLNGSLCTACDIGIEGQYLETDRRQKFHPRCFTCVTCRRMLRDDYFELNGKVYCERHAYTAAQKNRFAGGPRRNPERRTTRLMMM